MLIFSHDLLPQENFVLIGFYCSTKCSLDQKVTTLLVQRPWSLSNYSNDENMNNFITKIHSPLKVSIVISTMFSDVFSKQLCTLLVAVLRILENV